jgi:hypothetical protein
MKRRIRSVGYDDPSRPEEGAQRQRRQPDALALIGALALTIIALSAMVWQSVANDVPPADLVSGFEQSTEATTGRLAGPGVTTQYFGHSDELYPETDQVSGLDDGDDTTTAQTVRPGVTTQYFGNSGELDPEK